MISWHQVLDIAFMIAIWAVIFYAMYVIFRFVQESQGLSQAEMLENLGHYAKKKLLILALLFLLILARGWFL